MRNFVALPSDPAVPLTEAQLQSVFAGDFVSVWRDVVVALHTQKTATSANGGGEDVSQNARAVVVCNSETNTKREDFVNAE